MTSELKQSALFVDYENIFYFIRARSSDKVDSGETAISTIRHLRTMLLDHYQEQCIIQHAYADFERIGGSAQGAFYLMGIETHNVLGTDHKNAADMRLCIDAMDTLYTRPEIKTFVFVAGDRDYIPVVQHLRKHAKTVLVVSFRGSVSGDLLQVAEERNFIDASVVLPDGITLTEPTRIQPVRAVAETSTSEPKVSATVAKPRASTFSPARSLSSNDERAALKIMLDNFSDKPEIWMTPFLHRQRAEMSQLAEYERKALIAGLADSGAIAVEKRPGDQGEYSVIVVNWNHPDVKELNPG